MRAKLYICVHAYEVTYLCVLMYAKLHICVCAHTGEIMCLCVREKQVMCIRVYRYLFNFVKRRITSKVKKYISGSH